MTAKELAALIAGREVGKEITIEEARRAAEAGLVVVYGYSDDNVEFVGAIDDEVGAYEGATVYLTKAGILQEPDCGQDDCPYYAVAKKMAKSIKAIWHDEDGPCWTFETDIPHETFTVIEDGEPWCVGIVFSVEDMS